VLRQAQFVANEAVRSTGLRAGARVGALFAAPGRSCRQASSCTMIRLRWPDRSASGKRDSSAQRQTAQNRLQARNGSSRRPKRRRKSPPIAGFSAVSGKSAGSKDCVVGPGDLAQVSAIKGLCVKHRPDGALSALAFLGECQKQAWSRSRWHRASYTVRPCSPSCTAEPCRCRSRRPGEAGPHVYLAPGSFCVP